MNHGLLPTLSLEVKVNNREVKSASESMMSQLVIPVSTLANDCTRDKLHGHCLLLRYGIIVMPRAAEDVQGAGCHILERHQNMEVCSGTCGADHTVMQNIVTARTVLRMRLESDCKKSL